MKVTRRSFLKRTGGLAAGLMAAGNLPFLTGCGSNTNADKMKYKPFGLQLWTLRDVLPENPEEVLRTVAGFGYKQIQGFEGESGMFWGMGPEGFRDFIEDQGMKLISSHCNIFEDFEAKAGQAAQAGIEYLVCPWVGGQDSLDDYRSLAELFNECGEICRREGLRFAYHNHEYTFEKMDDIYPQDLLMDETDPDLVDFEMDIYWVVTAGQDPKEWIRKHPGRFKLSHVKDRSAEVSDDEMRASVILGTGMIDFPPLLELAREDGMKYFFVEQEEYEDTTPLESVEKNAAYMKEIFKKS